MQKVDEGLGALHVSPIQAVLGIARHAGDGMVVTRSQTFPFPACQVQVWEFTAALPPLDRPPVRVAVQFKGKIRSWIDLGEESYEDALDRYGRMSRESLAHAGRARAKAPSDAPEAAGRPALPPAPPGVRVTLPSRPGGKPFGFGQARGAPA